MIISSGDGGWIHLGPHVAEVLAAKGYFVVGFDAKMPEPVFDALERTAPLTSTGAALLGGFNGAQACRPQDCAVGYFTALLLLIIAMVIVTATTLLERRFRRRMAL